MPKPYRLYDGTNMATIHQNCGRTGFKRRLTAETTRQGTAVSVCQGSQPRVAWHERSLASMSFSTSYPAYRKLAVRRRASGRKLSPSGERPTRGTTPYTPSFSSKNAGGSAERYCAATRTNTPPDRWKKPDGNACHCAVCCVDLSFWSSMLLRDDAAGLPTRFCKPQWVIQP